MNIKYFSWYAKSRNAFINCRGVDEYGMKNKREKTREEKIAERLLYEKNQAVN